jgi:hypothetical protein
MKENCAVCCAVYSIIGIVLLIFFGFMFQRGAVSMVVISAKHGWDPQEKANACFRGAIVYGVTLFLSVMAKIYFAKSAVSVSGATDVINPQQTGARRA